MRHSAPCRKYGVSPWGAFGEFSESVNLLIEGLAHEGALKKHDKFGQSNYQTAFGKILLWLKRQWACVAVLTAAESRYAALGYTGGSAQQQAAAAHAQAQAQDDLRDDGAYRQREDPPSTGDFALQSRIPRKTGPIAPTRIFQCFFRS